MKFSLISALMVLTLATNAVAFEKKHEKELATEVKDLGFTNTKDRFLDSVYLKPEINFKEYQVLDIAILDTNKVTIRQPPSSDGFDEPWVLTDKDKTHLQEEFLQSFNKQLISTNKFKSSGDGKKLLIKTTLLELAPTASKDDTKSRPTINKTYTEGAGTITMKIELYDAQTKALVGVIADQAKLGNRWERNNKPNNQRQISLAFDRCANSIGDLLGAK